MNIEDVNIIHINYEIDFLLNQCYHFLRKTTADMV